MVVESVEVKVLFRFDAAALGVRVDNGCLELPVVNVRSHACL
jgi:hypothetical protein